MPDAYKAQDYSGAVACMRGGDGRWLGFSTRPDMLAHAYTRQTDLDDPSPEHFDTILNGTAIELTPRNQ